MQGGLCQSSLEKWPLLFPGARRVWEEAAATVARALTRPLPSSCNLTCLPGRYGANCAEACSCHDGACDPLTGACHMGECRRARVGVPGSATGPSPGLTGRFCLAEANQRMGVIGAGALLALLLILLLSLLCCCCVCRKKDEARG